MCTRPCEMQAQSPSEEASASLDPTSPSQLQAIQRAVRMTAQCREVAYDAHAEPNAVCKATLWCNVIGEYVSGSGPDEWTAVQAAHAIKAMHERSDCSSNPDATSRRTK